MNFLTDTLNLFSGEKSSHMGPHQFSSHTGSRNGTHTSGDKMWAEIEEAHLANNSSMNKEEIQLLNQAAREIQGIVPHGCTFVDLGPGTVRALSTKALPFISTLKCKKYIPVDKSISFLQQVLNSRNILGPVEIRPIIDDFFSDGTPYTYDTALACMFGCTIGNIANPMSMTPPESELIRSLKTLSSTAYNSKILISFDTNSCGPDIITYYKSHNLFQLNIFDRMAAELPINGDFNPLSFEYDPLWIRESGQLAHTAVATRELNFSIAGRHFSLAKGHRLHLKNSYKFDPPFFEMCAVRAGLKIIRSWSNSSSMRAYLLDRNTGEEGLQTAA